MTDPVLDGLLRKWSNPSEHEKPDSEQVPEITEPRDQRRHRTFVRSTPDRNTCPKCHSPSEYAIDEKGQPGYFDEAFRGSYHVRQGKAYYWGHPGASHERHNCKKEKR